MAKQDIAMELDLWVDKINESVIPLIVEGRKDRKALRNIGIAVPIMVLHSQPRYKLIEHVVKNYKEIIILTDNDSEGKRLFGILNGELSRFGIRINKKFREFLQKETELDQIEGIERYYNRNVRYPEN